MGGRPVAVAAAPRFGIAVSLAGASPLAVLLVWSPALAAVATVGLGYGVDGAVAAFRILQGPAEFARGGGEALPVTVAFTGTGGSVPLAVLFPWLTNLAYPWAATGAVPLAQDVLTVVAAAVVALLGRRYLGRERLSTDVIPAMVRHDGVERPDGAAGG